MDQEERVADEVRQLEARFKQLYAEHHRLTSRTIKGVHEPDGNDYLEAFQQWRFENPGLFTVSAAVLVILLSICTLLGLWRFSSTTMGHAIGFGGVKERIVYGYYGTLWALKVGDQASVTEMEPISRLGQIERVIGDMMIVSYFENGQQHRRVIKVANVVVQSQPEFQQWAKQYILKSVRLDFYLVLGKKGGRDVWATVLWHNRIPINIQLVEQRIGYPEYSPPTAVVSQLFSRYYWDKAFNGR